MPACWIEVNLDALRDNLLVVRKLVGADTKVIAVVKANAYGHGALESGREFLQAGAAMLAVTRLEEAIPLRQGGITGPILLLTPALLDEVDAVVEHGLTACLTTYPEGVRLSAAAQNQNRTVAAHLKINTGMGRLGVEPEKAVELAGQLAQLPQLQLQGAFTHFAAAAERDTAATHDQYSKFQPLIHHLSRIAGIAPQNCHCANSAALLRFPSMRLSGVRPGTLLYGQFPSVPASEAAIEQGVKLRDTFAAKARIISIKDLQPGQKVGYGGEWKAQRPSKIATIAIGFADGLTQEPQTHDDPPHVALRRTGKQAMKEIVEWSGLRKGTGRTAQWQGQPAPLIGRVAMQQCSIDITHLPGVQLGDAVTVTMRRTSAGTHLPRVYVRD